MVYLRFILNLQVLGLNANVADESCRVTILLKSNLRSSSLLPPIEGLIILLSKCGPIFLVVVMGYIGLLN